MTLLQLTHKQYIQIQQIQKIDQGERRNCKECKIKYIRWKRERHNRCQNQEHLKKAVFWDVVLVNHRRFGGTCPLHRQCDKNRSVRRFVRSSPILITMMMEALCSCETSVLYECHTASYTKRWHSSRRKFCYLFMDNEQIYR
jgi:hypothetical protein